MTPAADPGGAAREYQARADAELTALVDGLRAEQAALALAVLLSRAAARLHTLARAEAANAKGSPSWPAWAQLQNAVRTVVLNSSTARDLAAKLQASQGSAAREESEAAEQQG